MGETDFPLLVRRLVEGDVRFMVVGGLAAVVHGSARLTQDIDIVYDRSPENLEKLANALGSLSPYPRGAPPGLPFEWSAATLDKGLNFTMTTSAGSVDLLGEIPGGPTYRELAPHTIQIELFGQRCECLDLPTLIRTKVAAGRPKDLEAIAELEAIRRVRG